MEFVILKPKNQQEQSFFIKIDGCARTLQQKLKNADLKETGISEYNQRYLSDYLKNYRYYLQLYTQVLIIAIRNLDRPVEETVFVDYGGGSGIFSFLAKLAGFKEVVYNDIYDVSVDDARILSKHLDIGINRFVCGDIEVLAQTLKNENISAGLICSFDVLEHIYNVEEWLKQASSLSPRFTLAFSSSANIKNPIVRRRLRKEHFSAEYEGKEKTWGTKERDSLAPFFEIRKRIIRSVAPGLDEVQIGKLARQTRGLNRPDIEKAVDGFIRLKKEIRSNCGPSNTCDPLTGNWSEHLIGHCYLRKTVRKSGFAKAEILGSLYSFSEDKRVNQIKSGLNFIIRNSGRFGIIFSPLYILVAKKV